MSDYQTLDDWEDDYRERRRRGRNHCSSLRCEICGLPPLYNVHFGDGYVVMHWPARAEWLALTFAEVLAVAPPVGFEIYTCGSEICGFRAERHGVPGAVYATPSRIPTR